MAGSGKSTIAALLSKRGYKVFELSSELKRIMLSEHEEITIESLLKKGIAMRKKYGNAIVAKLALAHSRHYKKVVYSGLRSMAEFTYIKSNEKQPVVLIAVVAPESVRFKRLADRNKLYKRSIMYYRDKMEEKLGIKALIGNADFIISNTSTEQDLEQGVDAILERIGAMGKKKAVIKF